VRKIEGDQVKAPLIKGAVAGAVLLLAIATTTGHAEDLQQVSCSGFALTYADPAAKITCSQLESYGNQTEAAYSEINAETDSYFFRILYAKAKFHTYFPMRSLRAQIDSSHYFMDTDNWQEIRKFEGFEIAAFNGYQKAGGEPILCAGFSRYSGSQAANYEYDGGPGYPQHATGIYCAFSGQAALINPIDNFYRLVQDALSKMTFPSD
jgi:hypothetical protein